MVTFIVSAAILLIVLTPIIIFLIKGVRVKAYFDLETATFVVDAFVFGNVHAVKYKAFECNGHMYGQLNSRELKKLGNNGNKGGYKDENGGKNDEKQGSDFLLSASDKINALIKIFDSFPKIRLKTLRAYLTIGTGNSMQTSLIASSVATLLNVVSIATYDKIKVKNADIAVYPNFRHENTVFTLDLDTGAGLTGIMIKLAATKIRLRSAARKRRAEVK